MFKREAGWFLGNVALFLVLAFAILLVAGSLRLAMSADGSVGPGWSGPVPAQVFLWAFGSMSFAIVWFAPPMLVVILAMYRVAFRAVGHPRAVAYLAAAATASLVLLVPRAEPFWLVIAGIASVAYAAILRLPGHGLRELPRHVRGSVIGLSLSFVLLVGPVAAIAIANDEYLQGRRTTAGWILASGNAMPATLSFVDLWRDNVSGVNYVIAAAFVAVALIGLGLIARSIPTNLAKSPSRDR